MIIKLLILAHKVLWRLNEVMYAMCSAVFIRVSVVLNPNYVILGKSFPFSGLWFPHEPEASFINTLGIWSLYVLQIHHSTHIRVSLPSKVPADNAALIRTIGIPSKARRTEYTQD